MLKQIFTPNFKPTTAVWYALAGAWILLALFGWTFRPTIFPSTGEVLAAFPNVWQQGLGTAFASSLVPNIEALLLAVVMALPVSYLCRVPAVSPVSEFLSKLRVLSPPALTLLFQFMFDGHTMKVMTVAVVEAFFMISSMTTAMRTISPVDFDDAAILRMTPWQSVWYVNIRGTVREVMNIIADVGLMGWSMLIMVEGFVRSEGGIGVLLANMDKHMNLSEVYCITAVVIGYGMVQDYVFRAMIDYFCDYSETANAV